MNSGSDAVVDSESERFRACVDVVAIDCSCSWSSLCLRNTCAEFLKICKFSESISYTFTYFLFHRLLSFSLHFRNCRQEADAVQCILECVHESLLDIRTDARHSLLQLQMHAFASLVMWYQYWPYALHVWIHECLDAISHRIERMKDIIEARASG